MNNSLSILYRINSRDEFIFVNQEWEIFAHENDAPFLSPENILGKSLWNFITDATTEQIYREMVRKAREGEFIPFRFRCDSPGLRRLLEMNISASRKGNVEFETRTILVEERPVQMILKDDNSRTEDILRICGWCKKIVVSDEVWEEVEEAVTALGLFEQEKLPQLTHGICDGCYKKMSQIIKEKRLAEKRGH